MPFKTALFHSISVRECHARDVTSSSMYTNLAPGGSNLANISVYQHAGLRSLRIPATLSTKILVEDPENNSDEIRFDIRSGSGGMYNLMRWLVQKARAHEARIFRRQRKSSHRTGSAKRPVSRVRQRLAVKVLIRNAVGIRHWLTASVGLLTSIVRNE